MAERKNLLAEKGFHKGVDFGGWLSQCDYSEDRLNNFITEEDFKKVADWGLDHVRVPIDFNVLETKDGSAYLPEGFARVEKAVGLCRRYGLRIVIDLHKTAGFSFDAGENETGFFENEQYQERFYRLWEEISRHFGKDSDIAVFELLNEVTDQSFIGTWNKIVKKCIARIRAIAPDTVILVGSYWNNSAEAVKDLDAPFDDKIVYNFHCYSPLEFTHQGAHWAPQIDQAARPSFASMNITEKTFEDIFSSAIKKAEENNTYLYCGEYGVIDRASPEDILEWYKVINAVFEKHGISRCAWSYKEMDFGISDPRMDKVRPELLKYL